jgi:hypothetical protein
MQWILLIGAVVGAWALLSIVGGERQRRLDDAQARARAAAERAKAARDQESEPYVAS